MEKTTAVLLKFGNKEHLELLLYRGRIFCNTMHYFASLKDENLIGDRYEIVTEIKNLENMTLEIKLEEKGRYKLIHKGAIQECKQFHPDQPCGNLFCLYIHEIAHQELNKTEGIVINTPIADWCVVIIDAQEFVNRVKNNLSSNGYYYDAKKVIYENFSIVNGTKNQFVKDIRFQDQKEFRFWIDHSKIEPLIIEIGNLEDIAVLVKSSDLPTFGLKRIEDGKTNYFEKR